MQNWIKCVAVLMLAFMLFDVCMPERCRAELVPPNTAGKTLCQSPQNGNDSDSDGCAFEQDCFNCAFFAPGGSFVLESIAVVDVAVPDLLVSLLDRPPVSPYHPPRA